MMGLSGRLTVSLVSSLLVALMVLGGSLMVELGHYLTAQAYNEARAVARQTSRLASDGVSGQRLSLSDPGMLGAATGRSGLYLQVSQGNHIIQRSASLGDKALPLSPPPRAPLQWKGFSLWGTATPLVHVGVVPVVVARAPVIRRNRVMGFVESGVSLASTMQSIETVGRGLFRVGAAILALTSLVSALFVYRAFRRVRWLSRAATQIESADDLRRRISVVGPHDEVRELAQSFNHMLNRLEQSFQGQRLIIAQASHQLRTPLSAAVGYATMLRNWGQSEPNLVAEGIDAIHEQLLRLQSVIDIILRLAELEGEALHPLKPVSLEEFIKDWSASQSLPIHVIGGQPAKIKADKEMMAEALNILADNVRRHAGRNQEIQLSWTIRSDGSVLIVFQDQGPGFPHDILPHLFHPFAKGAKSSGTGLGLALARALLARQGAQIAALNAQPQGARLCITIASSPE